MGKISIHAPSRERQLVISTAKCSPVHFNPRSLAGATSIFRHNQLNACRISIHAPSRERLSLVVSVSVAALFQSTLPRGSDYMRFKTIYDTYISIHAPSRERPASEKLATTLPVISIHAPSRERLAFVTQSQRRRRFQSTLPRGSDAVAFSWRTSIINFNPRSLAGATLSHCNMLSHC